MLMNCAFNFWRGSHYINKIDEIIIKYYDYTTFDAIETFMFHHPNQKVTLKVSDIEGFADLIENNQEEFKNLNNNEKFSIMLNVPNYDDETINLFFKSYKAKFFYRILIQDWDNLTAIAETGVSQVYISGDLAFQLDNVKSALESKNIQIRVVPNIVQSSAPSLDPMIKFFIRPEDLFFYKLYVDTIEFYTEPDNLEKQDALYSVYFIDKKWLGDLPLLIEGFDNKYIKNQFIASTFGQRRASCKKRCCKGKICNFCWNQYIEANWVEGFLRKAEETKNKNKENK